MSRNGSGIYTLNTAGQPVVGGTTITSTAFNAATADIATAITQSICVDGQTPTTGLIPFALGFKSDILSPYTALGPVSLTAGQLKFPAAQNASSDANTLDDYEEGTCTFVDSSGGATVTDNGSKYTKIGRQVTIVALLSYGGGGNGSSTSLTGLPFTCRSNSSCIALGNTNQASGLAFVPTLNGLTGGFSTLIGSPAAVINSALNSTQLGFVLTYFTDT